MVPREVCFGQPVFTRAHMEPIGTVILQLPFHEICLVPLCCQTISLITIPLWYRELHREADHKTRIYLVVTLPVRTSRGKEPTKKTIQTKQAFLYLVIKGK